MPGGQPVETKYGQVQGLAENGVQVWKAIPYARPPLGKLRFRPPQPPQPWSGVRDATSFGPIAPQQSPGMDRLYGKPPYPQSEDCLYLNIWSPAADNKGRPVLIWIHGGGFTGGSGASPWYDGSSFASQGDMVVVTLNYRLGIFGFLHLAELGGGGEAFASSGNCGLLDQIAALEWVRDNIAAFGGDPAKVTVFGESAGSMSIGALLAMPAARGLFQKAIMQSGTANNPRSSQEASAVAAHILETLGVKPGETSKLEQFTTEQLVAVATGLPSAVGARPFSPVLDGASLPQNPLQAVSAGQARDISLMIGTTRDEMNLFTMLDPTWTKLDEQAIKERCRQMVMVGTPSEGWPPLEEFYSSAYADEAPLQRWATLLTAQVFGIPSLRLAEQQSHANGGRVWMYRFDWPSPAFGGILRACHSLEIPFVWNNLDKAGVGRFTNGDPSAQVVAERMHAAWIAFAHSGNPNTSNLPDWPSYATGNGQRATLLFDQDCRVENDPNSQEREVWEKAKPNPTL